MIDELDRELVDDPTAGDQLLALLLEEELVAAADVEDTLLLMAGV